MGKRAEWIERFNAALNAPRNEFARSVGLQINVVSGRLEYSEATQKGGRKRLSYREALCLLASDDIKALHSSR